ncbi:inhibitor of Bruton tyrosine kinase [Galleria mellonella]|uniref:Inhibitor of Bruton tyrosine kinase n=1 Tax=Galleria mellonella TaxID=7137 RepID=A0A6J1X1M0_GALME|nr:inhibitor of Bruton tyrosine kinase [Galleria mellonella]XP_031765614.2 inhibitor of Bruton tyrosine kinase [Galleria mellonella]
MSRNKAEVDCTRRCRSRNHGQALTSAITKRSSSDKSLACFIKATCANFIKSFDFEGRTALHMAASRGRTHLMDWLIRHSSEAFVNARDRESGYTPLHRSIFYGQIHSAVSLMKKGVNLDIVDKDDYKALEHAMLDRQYMYKHQGTQPSEVYVWGSNSNYTLGTSTQQQRNTPELLGCFNRNNTSVKQVCLGKFHSVWVCEGASGPEVWTCGQVARAGGPHSTALRPVQLHLPDACNQAAVMLNSTVFLLENGSIVQYTLNNTDNISQSGTKTPTSIKLPNVKPLMKLSRPRGVCASRWHAVFWNEHAVYTWGTNVGQLGHSHEDKVVPTPKKVAISLNNKDEAGIELAGAADAATVITTSRGDVYLLHKNICKKIAIKQINLRQVCVEAKVSEQGVYSRVTVLLLTNVGQLLIWQDTTNKLTRCVFGLSHQIVITQMTLTHDALYFTTKYGEAFIGNISRKAPHLTSTQPITKEREKDNNKSALVKFLEKDDCTNVRITKIPNIHRAVSIAVDSEGQNFACLQIKPTCGLTSLPELSPSSLTKHMETLLETASDDDLLHDVTFKVGTKYYPAHIFIIASSSEHLYKLYQEKLTSPEDKPVILLENVHPEVFDRILRYMYTGTCDVAELGPCSLKIRREDLNTMIKKEKNNIDVEMELIENPSEISAFEVYREHDKIKKNYRKSRTSDTPPRNLYCDPIKLVQATAKRLQVMGLHKLLEKFYYREGTVYLKDNASYSRPAAPCWSRTDLAALADTRVCGRAGSPTAAHRCLLAARLEYFHGMFMHSWTESKLLSQVTLPINETILLPVIDFLYTDSCPEIENSDSIDFICSMLIVADQLFITRLREMCEIALANLITLKNCSELCQFAHTYNATQLKQCCMEFISLNLCSILENHSLDHLEEALLEDITSYYCKFNPIMASRVITPFFNAPSDDIIDDCAVNFPIDLEITDEDLKRDDNLEVTKKKKQSKKIEYTESEKARMRYESVSSVTSLDLSNEVSGDITLSLSNISKEAEKGARDKQEKWIEVPSSQQKQQKVVQARLKAISSARDILNETPTESFMKLTRNNSVNSISNNNMQDSVPTTSRMSVSPKDSPITEMSRSSQGNLVISHIGPKMSQKQRKKLAMQGNDHQPQNLDDFMNKLILGSPPEKPKNPWKICEPPVASSSPNKKTIEFNQILTDQKKQKEDFSRIMTKPLTLTQLEDKAIEELERFYNIHEVDDELITVRRIELQVSSPQWIHTAPK